MKGKDFVSLCAYTVNVTAWCYFLYLLTPLRKSNGSYLFCSQDNWHHALWLSSLCAFINQNGAELHFCKSWITSSYTRATDHICILRQKCNRNATEINEVGYQETIFLHGRVFNTIPGIPPKVKLYSDLHQQIATQPQVGEGNYLSC